MHRQLIERSVRHTVQAGVRWAVLYHSDSGKIAGYMLLDPTPADVDCPAGYVLNIGAGGEPVFTLE